VPCADDSAPDESDGRQRGAFTRIERAVDALAEAGNSRQTEQRSQKPGRRENVGDLPQGLKAREPFPSVRSYKPRGWVRVIGEGIRSARPQPVEALTPLGG
jgi:hypothetical protein